MSALADLCGLVLAQAPPASPPEDHQVIHHIALCVVAACAAALVMRATRQPLILGYILAGVVLGPVGLGLIVEQRDISTISEIGLILLLFMIGLEIDLQKMVSAGRLVVVTGALQFPLGALLAWLAFTTTGFVHGLPALYAAVAVSLSSTLIVVKLLYDKMELDGLPGRVTVGILVFQDLWAIVVLVVQPNMQDPQLGKLLQTFAAGAALVGAALLASRYLLPRLFHAAAKFPELMLVLSLGWCFLVCLLAAHPLVGLSMEMGALVAGTSLATFPYNLDVTAKVVTIRDFFITLFFVALGMQIPAPSLAMLASSLLVCAVLLVSRVASLFGLLHPLGGGHRVSILASLNLAQMSEFSLVILALGTTYGHIEETLVGVMVWAFALLAVASTYVVSWSHPIQTVLTRGLVALRVGDRGAGAEAQPSHGQHPIVLLGFFRLASAFVAEVGRRHQHLLPLITVVDFNPQVKKKLDAMGVRCVYGDVGNRETLHHAHLENARVVLCTIPDTILKGTTNANVLTMVRALCPHARVVLTAESPGHAQQLYAAGADYVLQPSALGGASLANVVEQALHASLEGMRADAQEDLATRAEVLA